MSDQPVAPDDARGDVTEQREAPPRAQKVPVGLQIWLVLMALASIFAVVATSNDYLARLRARERQQQICKLLEQQGATKANCGHWVLGGFHVSVQGWNVVIIERYRYDILVNPSDEDVRQTAKALKKLGGKSYNLQQDPDEAP